MNRPTSLSSIHLALFMTGGVSLAQWERQGIFEREVALYRALRPHLSGLCIATYGGQSDLAFAPQLPGIEVLPNRWGLPARLYAAALPWLHRGPLARAGLLKTNQMKGALAALRVKRVTGARLIARCGYLWSLAAAEFRQGWRGRLNHREALRTERAIFPQADAVSVTTPTMKQFVAESYAVASERIRVVPNYVLDEFFAPPIPSPRPGRRIIFVGRLEPDKAPMLLIEAARGLGATVTLIGQGSLQPALARRAAEIGVDVEFVSRLRHHNLPTRLRAADVFVLPSPREGHPKTLIEAMACGLAVLGRDAPGIRDLIQPGQTGCLAQGDPAAFHDTLAHLLADAELRARLGRSAREYARAHFSFSQVLEAELALLQSAAGGAGAS